MPPAEYWFESHDGLRLFSRVYAAPAASAPVVLCLHGLMRNSRDFEDLALRLAVRYRVIAPDVRGRGLSDRDSDVNNYQLPVYVRDVLALLAGLGASRVAVIGTSMGGLMGMLLAYMRPGLVTRMVLNDIGPEVNAEGVERIRGYAGRSTPVGSWAEAVAHVRSIYAEVWPDVSDERWEKIARLSYRADAQGLPRADADPRIGEALRQSTAAAPDLWMLWSALDVLPVLAIRGEHSDILSAATFSRMQGKSQVTALTVANRGHAPMLDEPECVAAIEQFLGGDD
jgi:pimeloyl-ACP methyl ester carboxylesterase